MTTPTQTMTCFGNLADASQKAIELSRKYDQSFLASVDPVRSHIGFKYVIFTHPPYLKSGEELVAEYANGELING